MDDQNQLLSVARVIFFEKLVFGTSFVNHKRQPTLSYYSTARKNLLEFELFRYGSDCYSSSGTI